MSDPRQLDFIAIDPGDVHVGLAEFRGGRCVSATETRPQAIEDRLFAALVRCNPQGTPPGGVARPALLVVERFALRGDLMAQQQGSEFLTPQLIGSLRFICRAAGTPVVIQTPQQASVIKKRSPWDQWKPRDWVSWGNGGHAKVAEQHGYFYINEQLRAQDRAEMNLWLHGMRSGAATDLTPGQTAR